eukprot:3063097-Rhodomonas_salina.1
MVRSKIEVSSLAPPRDHPGGRFQPLGIPRALSKIDVTWHRRRDKNPTHVPVTRLASDVTALAIGSLTRQF